MRAFLIDAQMLLTIAAAVIDANGELLEANAGFLRLLPPECAKPIGEKVAKFFLQPTFAALMRTLESSPDEGYRGLVTIGDQDGRMRTLRGRVWHGSAGIKVFAEYDIKELERTSDAILDLNREAAIAQHAMARSNVALKRNEARIVESSLTDALTGVGNRRKLEQALATEIARVRRNGGALSAIMTDIDHFKRVNDEYGHGAGDKVLARFGALLKSLTRPTDVVAR